MGCGTNNPYITEPTYEAKAGSDCSGSSGAKNRTLTLSSTAANLHASGFLVSINGTSLHQGAGLDFTRATNVLTFLNNVDDADNISVTYFTYSE